MCPLHFSCQAVSLSGCPVIGVRHGVQPLIQWYLDSFEPGPHPMDGRASVMWRFINQVLILDYQAEIHHVFKAYGNSGSMRIESKQIARLLRQDALEHFKQNEGPHLLPASLENLIKISYMLAGVPVPSGDAICA